MQDQGILCLPIHKKKAILVTLGKLPSVTGKAYTINSVSKGFMLNSQIDIDSKLAPCMTNIVHTYCGDVDGTCLKDLKWLIEKFYPEMFENGIIAELTFDLYQEPKDSDVDGLSVEINFTVSQENCQHAKVLSSKKQIMERRELIYSKKMARQNKEKSKYDAETKDYQLNSLCEQKLYNICCESMNQQTPSDPTCATMNNSTNETTNNINVPSSYTGFQAVSSFVTADLV